MDRHRAKRAKIEQELRNLEDQIFVLEGKYIRETRSIGNVIDGWEKCLTTFRAKWVEKQLNGGRDSAPQKVASDSNAETDVTAIEDPVRREERIFSLSSVTSVPSTASNAAIIKPPCNPAPNKELPRKETPGKEDAAALNKQINEAPDNDDKKAIAKEGKEAPEKEALGKQDKALLDGKTIDKESLGEEGKEVSAKKDEEAPNNAFPAT